MVATSVGVPYEIYDLTTKVTVLRVGAFVINVALVIYLVVTKRLFGVRGGKKAYEAGCAANPSCKRRSMPWRGRPAHPARGLLHRRRVSRPSARGASRPRADPITRGPGRWQTVKRTIRREPFRPERPRTARTDPPAFPLATDAAPAIPTM
jgi:hypothetical protein